MRDNKNMNWFVRVEPDIKLGIEHLAQLNDRTPAGMVRHILRDALRAHKLLEDPKLIATRKQNSSALSPRGGAA
jgi:hypothetical protein